MEEQSYVPTETDVLLARDNRAWVLQRHGLTWFFLKNRLSMIAMGSDGITLSRGVGPMSISLNLGF